MKYGITFIIRTIKVLGAELCPRKMCVWEP